MATLTELSLVKGFTPEIVGKLQPFVTVYPMQAGIAQSKININAAPKEVIIALDDRISDSMAERVLEERRLHPFKLLSDLSNISGFSSIATGLVGFATTKGTIFKIISIARVKDSARTVEAVEDLNGNCFSWQEY
jgi:general secretion pathway protein K